MNQVTIECSAKINLGLDVINKRNDGYHNIKTIMQEIDLKDTVIIEKIEDGIIIESNNDEVPRDETNLVYKAWELMVEKYKITGGIKIYIEKNIPIAAGLAGGSTNAAGVLIGINRLWELNINIDELKRIGVKIGADIPFCLEGGTLLAEGIGDEFTKIDSFEGHLVLLVNPNIPISTARVYNAIDTTGYENINGMIEKVIKIIASKTLNGLGENLYNRLEDEIVGFYSEIEKIKQIMVGYGAVGSLMSGSGATVFGIFEEKDCLDKCKEYFENNFSDYVVIETKTL